ncbi:MAG: EcsC family protein [Clostridia bacterium]|nr:EcsC family protein [Clostridia bacterium]
MIQNSKIKQELNILDKKEKRFLNKEVIEGNFKSKIYEKIPESLEGVLNKAFIKAFEIVFNKGSLIIEKSFNKEKINLDYEVNKFMLDYKENHANIKKIDEYSKKANVVNNLFTTSVGSGMGILGLGIPDIPIFVATILRGIYQISLSYGFDYTSKEEQIYILRLIRIALAKNSEEKKKYNEELKNKESYKVQLENEIKITAKIMADALLIEKFIQGIPIIGVVGGVINNSIYRKISNFCMIKYKKRYLIDKLNK